MRSWSAEDRKEVVRFFSQSRKLGWDVYLIAQDADMIDKQVRNLFEYHVHMRNLRKARFMGLPLSPVNMFLGVWHWHAATRVVLKRELFPLSWRKNLYETHATSHGLLREDDQDGVIWLPSPPAERAPERRPERATAREDAATAPATRTPNGSKSHAERVVDAVDPADLDPAA